MARRSNELTKAEKIVAILESFAQAGSRPGSFPVRPSGAVQHQPYLYAAAAQPPAPPALVVEEEPEVRVLS